MSVRVFPVQHERIRGCSSEQLVDFGLQLFLLWTNQDISKTAHNSKTFICSQTNRIKNILYSPTHAPRLHSLLETLKNTPEEQNLTVITQ